MDTRPAKPPYVSHPLVITSDIEGRGKAQLTVPQDMIIQRVRAYTTDPAGTRVCRLRLRSSGRDNSMFWSPIEGSSDIYPPLHHLVTPDERPNDPCAFTGLRLKANTKWDVEVERLEGAVPFTIELVFFAEPECE